MWGAVNKPEARGPRPEAPVWRPPTRRAFVAMLGAAAALLAVRTRDRERAPKPTTLWIGHC